MAGAIGDEIDRAAEIMVKEDCIRVDWARGILEELGRGEAPTAKEITPTS